MRPIVVVLVVFLFSCTDKSIQSKIRNADKIEVIDTDTKFSHTDTSAMIVQGFREVLDEKPQVTDCPTQGSVLFKKGDKILATVGYYKDASECNVLVVDDGKQKKGYRLSQNALMYLGYYFQGLKKKNDAKHHQNK
jgi:hypothetical protein